jgi:hypothetical protein
VSEYIISYSIFSSYYFSYILLGVDKHRMVGPVSFHENRVVGTEIELAINIDRVNPM